MKYYLFCLFTVLFTVVPIQVQSVNDVPAILWNIKGDALHTKSVSAFEVGNKKFVEIQKEVLSKKSTAILVFFTELLSLEDMAHESLSDASFHAVGEFLDTHPHVLLPHVQDPLKVFHNVHCEKKELHLGGEISADTLQSVSSALDGSCIVIIHLKGSRTSAEAGKTQVDTINNILSSLSTSKKNVIGLFTAGRSSWESPENQRKSRSLLALSDAKEPGKFFNYSGCIIMYATNVTMTSISDEDPAKGTTIIVPLDFDLEESRCNASDPVDEFVVKFTNVTQYYPTLAIRMTFRNERSFWNLISSDLTIQNKTETTEHTEITKPSYVMEASEGFSYSCGKLTFETTNSTIKYIMTFEGFQIQPFGVNDGVFANSFDCVPFFTLPIWMGLLVGILFIIILNTGVYALFAVKTMDRFDDPKGKTISVAFSAD